jgi:hypothetical protein
MWKETAYRTVLQGRSIRPLVPALARFYSAPGWSHIISYSDFWSDHAALRRAAAALSPGSFLKSVKAREVREDCALSAEGIASELGLVGCVLRRVACIDVDFSLDMDDPQVRAFVEELTILQSSPPTSTDLNDSSHVISGSDLKSYLRSASTPLHDAVDSPECSHQSPDASTEASTTTQTQRIRSECF